MVTERIPTEPAPYVQVPSARRALAQMGANWYGHPAERMTMVGVTGTNGKTSVTLLLKSVLEQVTGARVGLVGTIQNMIGQEALPHRAHHTGELCPPGPAGPDGCGRGAGMW